MHYTTQTKHENTIKRPFMNITVTKTENASEYEAPGMSIQTKDLIRYINDTTYQRKNHAKPCQKFH